MSTIICPSGLTGTIRSMRVREERFLTDRAMLRSGESFDRVLRACWEDTLDHGPYDFGERGIDWGKVLVGDRFFVLLRIRAESYGEDFAFDVRCERCDEKISWEFQLRDLTVKPLSEESRAKFRAENRFDVEIPVVGRRAVFRLLTGADERRIAQLAKAKRQAPISTMLDFRLVEIEGAEDARARRTFLEELPMGAIPDLLRAFDEADCGVDTDIEVECPDCGEVQTVTLPFGPTFFIPEKARPKTRK